LIQTDESYVYGSTAQKLEYNVYEENELLKAKKRFKSNSKIKRKAVLIVAVIFAACIVIMYRYALITEMNYNISNMEKTYNELRNENSRLKISIEKDMDLERVRKIAAEKLEMQEPDRYQVVHIYVPKNDFTTVAEDYRKDKQNTSDNMFAVLLDKVSKFIRLFY
jgi:cell division protein FtsL